MPICFKNQKLFWYVKDWIQLPMFILMASQLQSHVICLFDTYLISSPPFRYFYLVCYSTILVFANLYFYFKLKPGVNTILVSISSPVNYAQNQYTLHDEEFGYPVLPVALVPEYRGEDKAQMIRKTQSTFSWDWGPSYPSCGIWWV